MGYAEPATSSALWSRTEAYEPTEADRLQVLSTPSGQQEGEPPGLGSARTLVGDNFMLERGGQRSERVAVVVVKPVEV